MDSWSALLASKVMIMFHVVPPLASIGNRIRLNLLVLDPLDVQFWGTVWTTSLTTSLEQIFSCKVGRLQSNDMSGRGHESAEGIVRFPAFRESVASIF
jgi:hypothetical protein